MEKTLLIKKIETLKGFLAWLPGQRREFLWMHPCHCWMPTFPRYLGFNVSMFGACSTTRKKEGADYAEYKALYPDAMKAIEDCGVSYVELMHFEYLIKFWKCEEPDPLFMGFTLFDNGLLYVSEWIAHLESELAAMDQPIRTEVTYADLMQYAPDETADTVQTDLGIFI